MAKRNRSSLYFEYVRQYTEAFDFLIKSENHWDMFYPIAFLFSQFMELWIKFSILSYDGFLENYTIKGLNIKGHDFLYLLTQDQTINEFKDLGVPTEAIRGISLKIEKLSTLCGTKELSYAFRYPDDGTTRIYMNKLSKKQKIEAIAIMDDIMHDSYAIFCKVYDGIVKHLIRQVNKLDEFVKSNKKIT